MNKENLKFILNVLRSHLTSEVSAVDAAVRMVVEELAKPDPEPFCYVDKDGAAYLKEGRQKKYPSYEAMTLVSAKKSDEDCIPLYLKD